MATISVLLGVPLPPLIKPCRNVSLEVFAGTEFNEIFFGRKPRQDVKFFILFGKQLRPYLQGVLVVW